jgi:tetratricopeptide (TPR) repeat protein
MARVLAHKKTTKKKSLKISRPAVKAKPKVAAASSHKNPASKLKVSSKKAKLRDSKKSRNVASSPARHPAKKERAHMEAESRKSALKPSVTSTPEAPPHLLRPTKTTSAALALLQKGIELIFQKEFKRARSEFKTLLETYPGEMDILARARSYMQICSREEAAQKKQAITTDQLYTLGVMEHNKGNYDKAISYFLQSLENHPESDYVYYSVAASLALKGDLAESVKNLRKAIELNEDSRIYAKNDSDFSALQTQKEFVELVGLNPSPDAET